MTSDPRAGRFADFERSTRETTVQVRLHLDAGPASRIDTGIGFLDHLLATLALHAGWSLELRCTGDLAVDDHHTAEDCAVALGETLAIALGDRAELRRFASAYAPLEESLARAVVDLARRPCASIALDLRRERLGELACENIVHLFRSLAMAGRFTLHLDVLRGDNDHHKAESAVKALALALRDACTPRSGPNSLKGVL